MMREEEEVRRRKKKRTSIIIMKKKKSKQQNTIYRTKSTYTKYILLYIYYYDHNYKRILFCSIDIYFKVDQPIKNQAEKPAICYIHIRVESTGKYQREKDGCLGRTREAFRLG